MATGGGDTSRPWLFTNTRPNPANPNLWRIVDGKLYLNITPTVVGFWVDDIDGNLKKSEANWQAKEAAPASTKSWKAINDNDGTYTVSAPVSN